MKKRYISKKRYGNRYKKRTTKRSSKFARRQQKAASTWIRKKYQKVFTLRCNNPDAQNNTDVSNFTVSLIGGPNQQNAG